MLLFHPLIESVLAVNGRINFCKEVAEQLLERFP
jgi:hypothetical protein